MQQRYSISAGAQSISKRAARSLMVLSAVVLALSASFAITQQTSAATNVLDDTIYQLVRPASGTSLLTGSTKEVTSAGANYGYTDKDELFLGSYTNAAGFAPVYRMYKAKGGDFTAVQSQSDINTFLANGYVNNGISFYASPTDTSTTEPVYRYVKDNKHRFALSPSDQAALEVAGSGWVKEGIAFYAVPTAADKPQFDVPVPPTEPTNPNDGDGKFAVAIMPDTQQEVHAFSGDQFNERTTWIVNQELPKDIRFVGHTGDMVSAGGNVAFDNQSQYDIASAAFEKLDGAEMPYLTSIGNHDTAAVCGGGAACPGGNIKQLVRDTSVFNQYFSTTRLKLANTEVFEQGKVDNAYKTFKAEGLNWLVLTLEMNARTEAVAWAQNVVASHPKHNVIITTHYLLEANGAISTSNSGYGVTSGRALFDNLVLKYPNVKMAFSGHVGQAASRTDTGINGNKVVSFVGAFHSNDFNPTRILTVDVNNNSVKSDIIAASVRDAYAKKYPGTLVPSYDEYDVSFTDMNFVRP